MESTRWPSLPLSAPPTPLSCPGMLYSTSASVKRAPLAGCGSRPVHGPTMSAVMPRSAAFFAAAKWPARKLGGSLVRHATASLRARSSGVRRSTPVRYSSTSSLVSAAAIFVLSNHAPAVREATVSEANATSRRRRRVLERSHDQVRTMSPFGPRRRSTSCNESSENRTCTGKLDAVRNLKRSSSHVHVHVHRPLCKTHNHRSRETHRGGRSQGIPRHVSHSSAGAAICESGYVPVYRILQCCKLVLRRLSMFMK